MPPSRALTAHRRRSPLVAAALALSALIASPLMLTATDAPAAAATGSEITLSSTEFVVGDSITVDVVTDRPHAKNWVAIYPASRPAPCDACGMAWAYVPGGSASVVLPLNDRSGNALSAGEYRIEYLYNDGYQRVTEPVSFTITEEKYEGPVVDPSAPIGLSVVQLNLWGRTTDAAMLDEIGADLIFLEEAQSGTAAIARELGFDHHSTGGSAGIVSRYPIVEASVISAPGTQGGWMKAVVQVGDTQVAAYSGHLEYRYYATYLPRGYAGDVLAQGFPSDWRGWGKLSAPVTDAEQVLAANEASGRPAGAAVLGADMANERAAGRLTILGLDMNEPSALDWTEATADLYDHNGVIAPWQTTRALQDSGLVDAYRSTYPDPVTHPGFTWPADSPGADVSQLAWAPEADERDRIDYIFYGRDDRLSLESTRIVGPRGDIVRGARVLPVTEDNIFTPVTVWTSDHKGLQAEFLVCGEACAAAAEPGELVVGTPSITGAVRVGETVTAQPGEWTEGTAFSYQWMTGGAPIDGATSASFSVPAELEARALSVQVTGSKQDYVTASARSAEVTVAARELPSGEEASVTLGATTVVAGGALTVTGRGLEAGAAVEIELHSTPVALGRATASASGAFTTTVTIPSSVAPGVHTLVVILPDGTQLTAPVTVTAAAVAGGSDADELARTGGEPFVLALLIGAGAIAAGWFLLRRRRARQH